MRASICSSASGAWRWPRGADDRPPPARAVGASRSAGRLGRDDPVPDFLDDLDLVQGRLGVGRLAAALAAPRADDPQLPPGLHVQRPGARAVTLGLGSGVQHLARAARLGRGLLARLPRLAPARNLPGLRRLALRRRWEELPLRPPDDS